MICECGRPRPIERSVAIRRKAAAIDCDTRFADGIVRRHSYLATDSVADQLMIAHLYNVDMRDLPPRVSVPILVVHCRNNRAIRPIFVVAPNLISADKTSRKWAESAVRSVLRCHQLCEIGRVGAYFDHLSLNCKQRRTRWRRGRDSNPRCRLRSTPQCHFRPRAIVPGKTV